MRPLFMGACVVMVGGTVLLVLSRHLLRRRSPETPSRWIDTLVALGVHLTIGAALIVVIVGGMSSLPAAPAGALGRTVGGLLFGLAFFALRAALVGAEILHFWVTSRPHTLDSTEIGLRQVTWWLLASCVTGIVIVHIAFGISSESAWLWVMLPFAVGLYPVFEHLGLSRVLLFLQRREQHELVPGLSAWVDEVGNEHGAPRVTVLVWPGRTDAFTVGVWPFRAWIVLGGALIATLTPPQVRAIVAHEFAHVVRRDVRTLFLVGIATGSAYALTTTLVRPLFEQGSFMLGISVAGVAGALLLGIAPGAVSRRLEFAADRFAVRLTKDPESFGRALEKFAELHQLPADRATLTHPSIRSRIQAISDVA